jgi:hypothetical protein
MGRRWEASRLKYFSTACKTIYLSVMMAIFRRADRVALAIPK